MADQLCTTAQVKVRLFPAGVADASDDALISELIDEVSGWVQGYTGRKFLPINSADYYFDTVAGYVLRVPYGIRAVTFLGVASAPQPDTGGTYTTVPAADYVLRPRTQDLPDGWPFQEIRIARAATGAVRTFSTAENGAKLTMTAGFAAIPKDIEAVTIDATVAAYQSRKNGASSVIGADMGALPPWSQFFGRGSPQRGTLDRYRILGV
jgi:hypothetical protein